GLGLPVAARCFRGRRALLALAQARRLADAVAQVIQLSPADLASPLHVDLGDLRRVQRKRALDALALYDAADGEHLAHAAAAPRDDCAAEDLRALLGAFQDALVDVHLVADLEQRDFTLQTGLFHQRQESVSHCRLPSRVTGPPTRPHRHADCGPPI